MLLTPSPILAHGGKRAVGMITIADSHEAILQPSAHRALHLATALLAPKLESLFIRLWHAVTLTQMRCSARQKQQELPQQAQAEAGELELRRLAQKCPVEFIRLVECGHSSAQLCIKRLQGHGLLSEQRSRQRFFAILDALRHFGDGGGAFGDLVFQLDLGGEGPFLLAHQLQHFLDRCLTLTPGHVATVGRAVLQVQVRDAVVILLEHGDR